MNTPLEKRHIITPLIIGLSIFILYGFIAYRNENPTPEDVGMVRCQFNEKKECLIKNVRLENDTLIISR